MKVPRAPHFERLIAMELQSMSIAVSKSGTAAELSRIVCACNLVAGADEGSRHSGGRVDIRARLHRGLAGGAPAAGGAPVLAGHRGSAAA